VDLGGHPKHGVGRKTLKQSRVCGGVVGVPDPEADAQNGGDGLNSLVELREFL
jgi:hypothetical protein